MKLFLLTTLILTSWKFSDCQKDDEKLIYTSARLPTNVYPVEYDLNITTFLPGYNWKEDERNMSYNGIVTVRLVVVNTTNLIVMHSDIKTQAINDITVTSKSNANLKLIHMVPSIEDQFLNMELNEEAHLGDELEITISFTVLLRNDRRGYYITRSKRADGVTMLNAVTQFEPVDARLMIPCFDEPEYKATWKVTLKYPTGAVALTNTFEEDSFEDGDFTVTTYKRTVKMSSYLLAIFIGDAKYKETISDKGTRIRVYADPVNIDNVDMALNHSRIVLEGFEKQFGIDFPMEKLDFVSVFDFEFAAMENWGLIVHKADAILGNNPFVTEVVIHELAHQWFGNLVTMRYWNETWLNEGFATYMTSYGESFVNPDYDREDFYIKLQSDAKQHDFEGAINYIDHLEDGSIETPSLIYSKGSSFIRMLERIVGTDNFNTAIRNYLSEHQYSNVEDKDLYAALEDVREPEENSISFESFAKCWTHQNGYPTVFVNPSEKGVILTQRREVQISTDYKVFDECGYKWDIPIWYQRVGDEKVEFVWFKKEDYELELQVDGPVIINADSNGYYSVVYSDRLYESIAKDLENNNKMYSNNTKLRLLSDSLNYALMGKTSAHNVAVLAIPLLEDENANVKVMSQMMTFSAMAMLKELINRSNEDIQKIMNSTFTPPELPISSNCGSTSSISDCVSELVTSETESGSNFDYCAFMIRPRSHATVIEDSLVKWLKTEKNARNRHMILKLLVCTEDEGLIERLKNDRTVDSTLFEQMRNRYQLKKLDERGKTGTGSLKSHKFITPHSAR